MSAPVTAPASEQPPILRATGLVKHFPAPGRRRLARGGAVHAVDGVDLEVGRGETLGVVGESGCGKTTLGRTLIRLLDPSAGRLEFDGVDITRRSGRELRALRARMQIVFQNPYAALDPRMTVHNLIAEPLRAHGRYRSGDHRIGELLELVGLSADHAKRYPHEFSGGQRQRIGIARALALEPELVVLDEPVSALDVSVQAQVVNLLKRLQQDLGVAYVFISHDLSVVRHVSDRVAVMYLGQLVEVGRRDEVYAQPGHPYTQALLSAAPVPDPTGREERRRIVLPGDVPSPIDPPTGCRFRSRCWKAQDVCATQEPELTVRGTHAVACHFPAAPVSLRKERRVHHEA